MKIEVKWRTVAEGVKELGEEQALKDLIQGYKSRLRHKEYNSKNQAILEAAKKDPRFRDVVASDLKKKSA